MYRGLILTWFGLCFACVFFLDLLPWKRDYGELLLDGKGIRELVHEVQLLTRRFNLLCPPALQKASKQWLSALIEVEIERKLDELK